MARRLWRWSTLVMSLPSVLLGLVLTAVLDDVAWLVAGVLFALLGVVGVDAFKLSAERLTNDRRLAIRTALSRHKLDGDQVASTIQTDLQNLQYADVPPLRGGEALGQWTNETRTYLHSLGEDYVNRFMSSVVVDTEERDSPGPGFRMDTELRRNLLLLKARQETLDNFIDDFKALP